MHSKQPVTTTIGKLTRPGLNWVAFGFAVVDHTYQRGHEQAGATGPARTATT